MRTSWIGLAGCLGLLGACGEGPAVDDVVVDTIVDSDGMDSDGADSDTPVVAAPTLSQGHAPSVVIPWTDTTLHRLSTWELENTLRRVMRLPSALPGFTGLPHEPRTPFDQDLAMQAPSLAYLEAVEAMALDLGAGLLDDPAYLQDVLQCQPEATEEACLATFVRTFGQEVWRTTLADADVDMVLDAVDALPEDTTFAERGAFIVSAMLQDPAFLYVVELGSGQVAPNGNVWLTNDEIAARMALLLWGDAPTGEAFALGPLGDLTDPDTRDTLARAMLLDPRAKRAVAHFHSQWLGYEGSLPPEGAYAMREQADAMVERIVFDDRQPWTELFLTTSSFLTPFTADEIYHLGAPPVTVEGWQDVRRPERVGLLSWGAFLSVGGRVADSSPTLRGKLVAERLLCDPVPPPPPNVNADAPPPGEPGSCKIARYEAHRSNPSCAGCHERLDGVGMGLEGFDAYARKRTYESDPATGQTRPECPVPTEGEVPGLGPFSGPAGLAQLLVGEERLQACMMEHLFQWAQRGQLQAGDRLEAALWTRDWLDQGADFQDLLVDYIRRDAFAQQGAR